MSACKRLDSQTLGSQPVMPKNLSDHCTGVTLIYIQSMKIRVEAYICYSMCKATLLCSVNYGVASDRV